MTFRALITAANEPPKYFEVDVVLIANLRHALARRSSAQAELDSAGDAVKAAARALPTTGEGPL